MNGFSPAREAAGAPGPAAPPPGRWRRSGRDMLPPGRLSGPMPWMIAIMVGLTVLAAGSGLALRHIAVAAGGALGHGVSVQILEPRADLRQQQAAAVLAALKAEPGVLAARQVPEAELDALIAPWLGGENDPALLPSPALIDVTLDGPASASRLAALRAAAAGHAPQLEVDTQASWLAPVFGAIASLQWLAAGLVVLLGAALCAAVLLAVRTGLGNHRATLEIVHLLGGTDRQIARVFQRSIALDAALGGAVGLAGGAGALWLVGTRFGVLGAGLVSDGALAWPDWLALAGVPVAGVLLAMATARLTVLAALKKML
ncbi:MAG TPA: cell division protein [Novosphingobium sp.]|nr:cell division protein [Novosphingobium sp.]